MRIVERPFAPSAALSLVRSGVNPALAKVLAARGVVDGSDVRGDLSRLVPYTELLNCQALASVLADAVQARKRLLIVADYDADGATACSVGIRALRAFGANVDFVIPDRVKHGYGLTPEVARIACSMAPKPDFLVTVDNGIASHAGIDEANRLGVPVLVTDHHLPAETTPAARLIVNPNQRGCGFPSKALAGVGVMFYVMWALQHELMERGWDGMDSDFDVFSLLPIVAIGTVADVVPLDLNNRILVAAGLRQIRAGQSFCGIESLVKVSGKSVRSLSTADIAFGIGPRINAAGRLETMDAGVHCLTTDDPQRAAALAETLHEINVKRKEIEGDMTEEALQRLVSEVREARFTAVLHGDDWHQGVIGIVASRLKEKVWRPTFIMATGKDGELKGSGRSIPGFHLRDALDIVDKRNPGLLLKFGGHAMAAGVTVRPGGLQAFSDAFEAVGRELLKPSDLNQELEVDGSLQASEMTLATVAAIKELVWGQAFPEPMFFDEFRVVGARPIGGGKHLKLVVEKDGRQFQAVKFRHADGVPAGRVSLAYKLEANTYRDEENLQLLVEYLESA